MPDTTDITVHLSLLVRQPGRYTRTAFGRWYECTGPDGHKFTNSAIDPLRRALKKRYGTVKITVTDHRSNQAH